jgi:protocatechuate 3,4-dioxygenase beta subunit
MPIRKDVIFTFSALAAISLGWAARSKAGAEMFESLIPDRLGQSMSVVKAAFKLARAREQEEQLTESYRKALERNPDDTDARESLKRMINRPNPISDEQGQRVRAILRLYARPGRTSLVTKDEPGERLEVSGAIRDTSGKPVAGAVIYVFQTDAQGHYTRAKVMNEPHARLFAFIRTGADGRYEFSTIRPGGYPGSPERQGEQWRIPQHIHFEVTASGFQERRFQMVFDDDPRMTSYWHNWATKGKHPVVSVKRDQQEVQHCVNDVVLQPLSR